MTENIQVLVAGFPGDMSTRVFNLLGSDINAEFSRASMPNRTTPVLCGHEHKGQPIDDFMRNMYSKEDGIIMIKPDEIDENLKTLKTQIPRKIYGINFADASGYDVNFKFVEHGIPFISGVTGASHEQESELVKAVVKSDICAVIDKNMSPALVVFGAMLKYAAETFPGALKGYTGFGIDEHQVAKKDGISGTLLKWTPYLEKLGIDFVPLKGSRKGDYGHADHIMRVSSPSGDVRLNWMTEVLGRDTYARGTVEKALPFLRDVMENHSGGVYDMETVLRGNSS